MCFFGVWGFFPAFLGSLFLTELNLVVNLALERTFLDNRENVIHFPRRPFWGIFPVTLGGFPCTTCVQQDPLWASCSTSTGKEQSFCSAPVFAFCLCSSLSPLGHAEQIFPT